MIPFIYFIQVILNKQNKTPHHHAAENILTEKMFKLFTAQSVNNNGLLSSNDNEKFEE